VTSIAAARVSAAARQAGGGCVTLQADVTRQEDVERLFGEASRLGTLGGGAVAPGVVNTEIHTAAGDPDRAEQAISRIPLGRAGEPEDIAPEIAWLLGPAAGYASGAVLRVAGGL